MKIGVILSGCGVRDGSELHEAVLTLLALDQHGATYQCMAPSKMFSPINHVTGQPEGTLRNVLVEAARIARGNIVDLSQVNAAEYDAFILPGGFGAAGNLCNFKEKGPQCDVDPQVQRVLTQAHAAGKPLAFLCIAPALAARVFGAAIHPTLTIGNDPGTAAALEKMGAKHQNCEPGDCVVDAKNKILSTPAYMYDPSRISMVYQGIDRLVAKLVAMASASL